MTMNTPRLLAGIALAGLLTLSACGSQEDAPPPPATTDTAQQQAEVIPEVEPNGTVIEIEMLTRDPESGELQVFKPRLVTAKVGDTVKFVPADPSHNSASIADMLPEGVRGWNGDIGREVSFVVPKPGIYGYKCTPHYAAGMVGLIIVEGEGMTDNLEAAKSVTHPGLAGRRFEEIFEEAASKGLLGG